LIGMLARMLFRRMNHGTFPLHHSAFPTGFALVARCPASYFGRPSRARSRPPPHTRSPHTTRTEGGPKRY
jgi:hypothetical protein